MSASIPAATPELKVLVVGAGGIGCEVLKNLVLSGVRQITIVDLDMVDVSNLNRQFLFSKADVGAYKADVAAKAIRNYMRKDAADELHVTAHKCRIQDMSEDEFRSHNVVISALDNIDARRYVNGLCVTYSVPLMEAGSTGSNGQSYPLVAFAGGECFECRAPPKVTAYPVCTIRLTADKPEHCVAWARYLIESIFQQSAEAEQDENALTDLGQAVRQIRLRHPDDDLRFAVEAAKWLFNEQIENYRKTKLESAAQDETQDETLKKLPDGNKWMVDHLEKIGSLDAIKLDSSTSQGARAVQSPEYYAEEFVKALANCWSQFSALDAPIKFDKDSEDMMHFVGAASNLRMVNFHIPMLSAWDLKSMAGAIQPAIASTNAIVAGIEVMNALRLVKISSNLTLDALNAANLRFVWTRSDAARVGDHLLLAEKLDKGNPSCLVCSNTGSKVELRNFDEWTLRKFVEQFVLQEFPTASLDDLCIMRSSGIIYDPDYAEDCPEILDKTFLSGQKSVGLTVSSLKLGAMDMVVEESNDLTAPYRVVHKSTKTLTAKDWAGTVEHVDLRKRALEEDSSSDEAMAAPPPAKKSKS